MVKGTFLKFERLSSKIFNVFLRENNNLFGQIEYYQDRKIWKFRSRSIYIDYDIFHLQEIIIFMENLKYED